MLWSAHYGEINFYESTQFNFHCTIYVLKFKEEKI